MNGLDEEALRELNLWPRWVRRELPAAPVVQGGAERASPKGDENLCGAARQDEAAPQSKKSGRSDFSPTGTEASRPVVGLKPDLPPDLVPQATPDWATLKQQVRDCVACPLRAGCTQTVFGVGDEQAEWLFVGEGPGADEDARGEPFVGQAGRLLDNMLAAIHLKRGRNVYIANVVKCRPPNNRTPEAAEIAACLPYLKQQIALIQPKLIVALGKTAATALLGRDASLGSLRGALHDYHGTPLLVTYHPAYLLRSPAEKAKAWQDLRLAVATLQSLQTK